MKNSKLSSDIVSEEFKEIVEGMEILCDLHVPKEPPVWLDKDSFFRGQQYFKDNRVPVMVGCLRNLVIGLFVQSLWYTHSHSHVHVFV